MLMTHVALAGNSATLLLGVCATEERRNVLTDEWMHGCAELRYSHPLSRIQVGTDLRWVFNTGNRFL